MYVILYLGQWQKGVGKMRNSKNIKKNLFLKHASGILKCTQRVYVDFM